MENILKILTFGKSGVMLVVQLLTFVAGYLASLDSDNEGNDDLAAGICLAVADGVSVYDADKYDGEQGDIVDSVIASLKRYKDEMVKCGRIKLKSEKRE